MFGMDVFFQYGRLFSGIGRKSGNAPGFVKKKADGGAAAQANEHQPRLVEYQQHHGEQQIPQRHPCRPVRHPGASRQEHDRHGREQQQDRKRLPYAFSIFNPGVHVRQRYDPGED